MLFIYNKYYFVILEAFHMLALLSAQHHCQLRPGRSTVPGGGTVVLCQVIVLSWYNETVCIVQPCRAVDLNRPHTLSPAPAQPIQGPRKDWPAPHHSPDQARQIIGFAHSYWVQYKIAIRELQVDPAFCMLSVFVNSANKCLKIIHAYIYS